MIIYYTSYPQLTVNKSEKIYEAIEPYLAFARSSLQGKHFIPCFRFFKETIQKLSKSTVFEPFEVAQSKQMKHAGGG
jgi:hypothetical protein